MRALVAVCLWLVSGAVFAQASAVQFSSVVCGPSGLAGVTYVTESGRTISCGTDSSGNALVLQVSTLSPDEPVYGGDQVGLDLGAAVLGVFAVAWGVRFLRRHIETSGDG